MTSLQRLFDPRFAFDSPVTTGFVIAMAVLIAAGLVVPWVLKRRNVIGPALADEVVLRTRSWVVLALLIGGPILLGAAWTILGLMILALLCYAEFARATGLFREFRVSVAVIVCIGVVFFAVADHWYGLFVAAVGLGPTVIAIVAITADRPVGYIQRVAIAVFAFLFMGAGLGHLAYFANDADYRPILLTLIAAVELNDIFAFLCGKTFGRRRLIPHTSPGKTVAGALGAVVLTTLLIYIAGGCFLRDGFTRYAPHLLGLGVIVSIAGQFGDLVLSSIKRDLNIKDMGATIPGHGGLLDRFDSLLIVSPAVFYYILYFRGIGETQPTHLITGPLLGLPF